MGARKKLTPEVQAQIVAAVRAGAHAGVAFTACGLSEALLRQIRYGVRHKNAGWEEHEEFLEQIAQAEGQCEVGGVIVTRAAEHLDKPVITCPECGEKYKADPMAITALVGMLESGQRMKASAADVAMKRLERRFPKRWSQKVIHTVQEEHERLLDVCQRVLAPEVFEALCEEYLASDGSESEAADGQSGPATGDVH